MNDAPIASSPDSAQKFHDPSRRFLWAPRKELLVCSVLDLHKDKDRAMTPEVAENLHQAKRIQNPFLGALSFVRFPPPFGRAPPRRLLRNIKLGLFMRGHCAKCTLNVRKTTANFVLHQTESVPSCRKSEDKLPILVCRHRCSDAPLRAFSESELGLVGISAPKRHVPTPSPQISSQEPPPRTPHLYFQLEAQKGDGDSFYLDLLDIYIYIYVYSCRICNTV